ncbi:hypothetical protein B0H14DRAFT_3155247, partial [Mycena olivaceomarginata]
GSDISFFFLSSHIPHPSSAHHAQGKVQHCSGSPAQHLPPRICPETGCRCPGIRTHTVETVNGHKGSSFPTVCGSRYFYYATHQLVQDHCAQVHKLLQQCLQEITRGGALSLGREGRPSEISSALGRCCTRGVGGVGV